MPALRCSHACLLVVDIFCRCRTITVDVSTKVALRCRCQHLSGAEDEKEKDKEEGEEEEGEGTGGDEQNKSGDTKTIISENREEVVAATIPAGAAGAGAAVAAAREEASSVRLFTSCSDEVSIIFAGVLVSEREDGRTGSAPVITVDDGGDDVVVVPATYKVPKDGKYEKGDGHRSLSRITFCADDGGGGGGRHECKTLRCDQYGTPLKEAEAAAAGVPWTWEHGLGEEKKFTSK